MSNPTNPNDPKDRLQEVKSAVPSMTREKAHEVAGVTDAEVLKALDMAQKLKTQQVQAQSQPVQQQTSDPSANIDARIKEMEAELLRLKQGQNGVKVVASSRKVLDFSKLSETDVYDLSIPIQAIPHGYLDPTQIKLKDPCYVARYVNWSPRNMGPRKAIGYTFVEKEDIDFDSVPMGMDLEPDENGKYTYIDTVLMKIPKEKYFPALRAKHIQAMAVVDKKKALEIGKAAVEQEMMTGEDPDAPGQIRRRAFNEARNRNQLEVYI